MRKPRFFTSLVCTAVVLLIGGTLSAQAVERSTAAMAKALGIGPERFNLHQPTAPKHANDSTWAEWGRYTRPMHFQVTQAAAEVAGAEQPPGTEEASAFSSVDEAARQSSNPLGGDFMILLNQIDNYFLQGDATDNTRKLNVWSVQPVIPIPMTNVIGENWIWVNRPTFPFVMNADVPDRDKIKAKAQRRIVSGLLPDGVPRIDNPPSGGLPFESESGLGDIVYFSLLGQSLPHERWGGGDFVWALGPTFQFPTASDRTLGTGKYSAGPSGVLAFIGRKFILGGLYQQWLSFADGGNGPGEDVNFSWLNLFYFLNLENGWQVGGTPIFTADWESDDTDDRFTIPLGLGVYKTHFFGKMPMKLGVEFQWMPIRPDTLGQEFNIRFVIAPIVPSFFK